jgi:hypothetical protein
MFGVLPEFISIDMIFSLAGLAVGSMLTWLFISPKLDQRDESIEELEKSTKKHEKKVAELKKQSPSWRASGIASTRL